MNCFLPEGISINLHRSFTEHRNLHSEPGNSSHYSVWLWAGRPGDRGSIPGRGERIFPLAYAFRQALGTRGPFPGAKVQLGHYADHSP
jgi:hypothetical protein